MAASPRFRIPRPAGTVAGLLLLAELLCFAAHANSQENPVTTIDQECMAFAYAPDGKIAYGVRHVLTTRRFEIQRDDIWLMTSDGKRRRIVNGEKLVRSQAPYSYTVQSLRWSPDGSRLTAELLTSEMINEAGDTKEGVLTLLLDESGKEIKIAGGDSVIQEATNATWLGDGVTVVYLQEAVKPKLLFGIGLVRPVAGRGGRVLADHVFAAVAWDPKRGQAVAIERDAALSGPPRLVRLDILKETTRDLVTLDGYSGRLTLSPSGTKVAYFRDHEVLEIRDLASPERMARLRVAYGVFQWTPDERRILLKRGLERKTADLVWINVPELVTEAPRAAGSAPKVLEPEPQPALHGLTFRDFEFSPDGRFLAVIQPGKRNLLIYPIQ
jgi:dipeptidyl aminopeptidase/acylaminoacyl peptidase